MYPIAWADFQRFILDGVHPTKNNGYSQRLTDQVINDIHDELLGAATCSHPSRTVHWFHVKGEYQVDSKGIDSSACRHRH